MNLSQNNQDTYKVTGLMSGTSLDGVDIAFCIFTLKQQKWHYSIERADTFPYPDEWRSRLSNLENKSALDFVKTDAEYGHYLGKLTKEFHLKNNLKSDFIASHGHTIFHQPENGITSQIGKGSAIAAETGIPVVCDFRSTDVAMGGQGAPLVPVGDQLLFSDYDYCINLGGFANVSFVKSGKRIAYDICPVNIVLNFLASLVKKPFDDDGNLARNGKLNRPLLDALNSLPFYQQTPPKSLGKEWVIHEVHPILENFDIPVEDKSRTFTEHVATQITNAIEPKTRSAILITGGGAFNSFLIERISEQASITIKLPDPLIINFKEALIFAFLGVLRWREEINCLKSCTGANHDNTGGAIYRIF